MNSHWNKVDNTQKNWMKKIPEIVDCCRFCALLKIGGNLSSEIISNTNNVKIFLTVILISNQPKCQPSYLEKIVYFQI